MAEGFHTICRNRLGVPLITIIFLNKTRIEWEAEQYTADRANHFISMIPRHCFEMCQPAVTNAVLSMHPQKCPQCHLSGYAADTHRIMLWKLLPGGLQHNSPLILKSLKRCLRDTGIPQEVQRWPKVKYQTLKESYCQSMSPHHRARRTVHSPIALWCGLWVWTSCMEKEILSLSRLCKPTCRQQGFSWVLHSSPKLTQQYSCGCCE